jgi:HAD superfamily hydrolase (TIGR01549 family)
VDLTLLLDLDDTLLTNDIRTFLPAYLQALSKELAPYAHPDTLVTQLLSATKRMVENQRPDLTLKEVFESSFYPALNLQPEDMRDPLNRFYAEVFPSLQTLTSPRPEAVELVKTAIRCGFHIVIATNPLFPRSAIEHRLAWAGLPVNDYPFDLVSSYETLHFSKPRPAYFAELLGRLGWPEGPVLMVGDDLQNDISGARQLGLPVFWINQTGAALPDNQDPPTASGTIGEVIPWLSSVPLESLQPYYNLPSAMLAILRSTPALLDTLCRDLSANMWTERPLPDEWCPTEIICHLRDVEAEVNLPRLQKVLNEENPFLAGKDTDPWADQRNYIHQNGLEALKNFTAARVEGLTLLEDLQPEAWQLPARHAILGPTDLEELVGIIASHDRLHIQQITQSLNTLQNQE